MFNSYNEIKCCLDICESMIDRLQRELYSNNAMLGAVNSAFEKLNEEERAAYKTKRKQLNNLLSYKTKMLDFALNVMKSGEITGTEPTLTVEDNFSFEN